MNAARKPRRIRPPLTEETLRELALAYVGRFATTRRKLRDYLARKIRERGWAGDRAADLTALADAFAEQGFIDDKGYALAKAQSLASRGYGKRRVVEKLRLAGVDEDDGLAAREHADREAVAAALRFAERRRLGPFAVRAFDRREQEKALAAMVRAGHGFALARTIVAMAPGDDVDIADLQERARYGVV